MLMATLSHDAAGKADCYRQVLRIDPRNRRAARRLKALEDQLSDLPSTPKGETMRCPQCGGDIEVRFMGRLQDKRAHCHHCHSEVDLPDAYRRITQRRTHERRLAGTRTVEETVIEARQDGKLAGEGLSEVPPELQEALKVLKEKGNTDLYEDVLQALKDRGIGVSLDPEDEEAESRQATGARDSATGSAPTMEQLLQEVRLKTEERNQGFLSRWFTKKKKPKRDPGNLTTEELIELAGGGLPPEERSQCPNAVCGATVSKSAHKCPWCGQAL
jgi:hypothetical protein